MNFYYFEEKLVNNIQRALKEIENIPNIYAIAIEADAHNVGYVTVKFSTEENFANALKDFKDDKDMGDINLNGISKLSLKYDASIFENIYNFTYEKDLNASIYRYGMKLETIRFSRNLKETVLFLDMIHNYKKMIHSVINRLSLKNISKTEDFVIFAVFNQQNTDFERFVNLIESNEPKLVLDIFPHYKRMYEAYQTKSSLINFYEKHILQQESDFNSYLKQIHINHFYLYALTEQYDLVLDTLLSHYNKIDVEQEFEYFVALRHFIDIALRVEKKPFETTKENIFINNCLLLKDEEVIEKSYRILNILNPIKYPVSSDVDTIRWNIEKPDVL